ncbi:MAG: indole-3-glycerol phosphate synthase TrpC [Pseudomonadota bacterium]|nr:indole-3-glycerol phosphate synthase TrpC [Pseudomonadota bacterium]
MAEDILEKIRNYKLEEIKESKKLRPLKSLELEAKTVEPPRGFAAALINLALDRKHFGIIAEIKKASPSKGIIRPNFNVSNIASAYEKGGAACLSVLTDFPSFKGKGEYLKQAKESSKLPTLRKDFLYDPYQIVESRAMGADCVLIILADVTIQQAAELESEAFKWGMDVLLEVHNERELKKALQLKSKLIGINNRNLNTFEVNLTTTENLAQKIPKDYHIVSESGFFTFKDLERVNRHSVNSFLIGESLMRKKNIKKAISEMLNVI